MRINSLVGGAAVGLIAAMAFAGAATAQDTELPSASDASEYLSVTVAVTGNCAATITYTNTVPDGLPGSWAYWGDYRTDNEEGVPDSDFPPLPRDDDGHLIIEDYADAHDHGVDPEQQITDGPLAGEMFGLQYNPVLIHQGETVTVPVEVDAPTTLAAWIKRGPVQEWYVGEVAVEVPCEQADDTPPTTPTPTTPPADDDDTAGGTGGGDADDSDTLPVTGSPALLLAGGAVLLLAAGGVTVLMSRRRRVSFTA